MGWFFIVIGVLIVGACIYAWLRPKQSTALVPYQDKVELYQSMVTPNTGYLEAKVKKVKIKAQDELQSAVNAISTSVIVGEEIRETSQENTELRKALHGNRLLTIEQQRRELQARNQLIAVALSYELDVPDYLKYTTHVLMKDADLQARAIEYQQDQEQITKVQQEKLQLIDSASARLNKMYDERKRLQKAPLKKEPAKEDKLRHLNFLIEKAEELIRGEQIKYLEDAIGQEAPRGLGSYDSETGDREEGEAAEEQVPAPKRGPGRPRGSTKRGGEG